MVSVSETLRRHREPVAWLIAAFAAVVTGVAMRGYLDARSAEAMRAADARYRPTPIVVAREDLAPGSELSATRLAVRNMPGEFLPASVVGSQHAADVIGRTVQHAVRAGEPIQMPLLKARTPERLAERIALGRRAVTIAVDEAAAAAGLLRPGDRVDLLWRGRVESPLENVPVICDGASDRRGRAGLALDGDYATITLELPEAAARRVAASDSGAMRVLLRNPADTEPRLAAHCSRSVAS